jgi:DNA-directed RNA polymerase specialized sigma24 family protein
VHEGELPDALDEVVRMLLANRSAFTGGITFSAFCFGVAARLVGRRKRRRGTRTSVKAMTETMAQIRSGGPSMDETIEAALGVLPFRLRVVLVAVEMQQMSLEELAHVLDLPTSAGPMLEARLQRARVMFASALQGLERAGPGLGTR